MPTSRRSAGRSGATKTTPGRVGLTISRRICGRGFSYHSKSGHLIRDPGIIARLARLAVPPAYVDVAYSAR